MKMFRFLIAVACCLTGVFAAPGDRKIKWKPAAGGQVHKGDTFRDAYDNHRFYYKGVRRALLKGWGSPKTKSNRWAFVNYCKNREIQRQGKAMLKQGVQKQKGKKMGITLSSIKKKLNKLQKKPTTPKVQKQIKFLMKKAKNAK